MSALYMKRNGTTAKHVCSLPPFDCPLCDAKHLAYALDARQKNASRLIPFSDVSEEMCIHCVLICPKCKKKLALCTKRSKAVPA